ncbi:MAG: hypothetical protein NTU49_00025, partial [Gammaproteobacteria bacterium]|nr:hypothetical protein [Gammaproteobacteria bacterium]
MFKKNLVLKFVIIAIILLFCYKGILPIIRAKTLEKKWKSIETDKVAAYVVNEFERQIKEKEFPNIVLLDSNGASVLGATNLTLTFTRNNVWKFRYDFWTIQYKNYSLPMTRIGETSDLLKCSFCGKTQKQVKKLIAGPGVYICDECI